MPKIYEQLSDIPTGVYEGYIWPSNAKTPVKIEDEHPDFSKYPLNPFIIEGLLYDKQSNTSIIIRHTGKYHISEFQLNALPEGSELEGVEFLPHRLAGISKVCFKQLWVPEADFNCGGKLSKDGDNFPGMEVLTMKALLFTGFKKQ